MKKNKKANPELITDLHLTELFNKLNREVITKNSVMGLLTEISLGKKVDYSKYEIKLPANLESEIKK